MAWSRERSYVKTVSKGWGWHATGIPWSGNGGTINVEYHGCDDVVRTKHEPDCQPFHVLHYAIEGGRLNKSGAAGNGSHCENRYPTVYDTWNNFPHHSNLPGNPSDAVVAANAAYRTSPSKPYVDSVVYALELLDLVTLLRDAGNCVIKKAANINLAWEFGLRPLLQDFDKLLEFQDQLDRRIKVLNKLKSRKSYRKTTQHGTYSASGTYFKTLQSQGIFINRGYFCNTKQTVSAHCRWVPVGTWRQFGDADMRRLARKAVLGHTLDASTLWELLPWSWLIDWATNAGQFLSANRNIVPAQLESVSVIRHTRTEYELPAETQSDWSLEACRVVREDKDRRRVPVVPTAHFRVLNGKQMGILSSLAVLRFPKYLL